MTQYRTTREALEAHVRGEASLDEVSEAADRAIERYAGAVARSAEEPPARSPREPKR
jgi:hypothetical protein